MRLLLVACVVSTGCMRPVQHGRTERFAPPTARELEARQRVTHRKCSPEWGMLVPGLGHVCNGQGTEGAVIGGVAAAEIGTAVVVGQDHPLDHPGVGIPLIALQDLWLIDLIDPRVDEARAQQLLYAPQDSLVDLAAAPFNPCVLGRPWVIGGLAAMLAAGIGVTLAVDGVPDRTRVGADPNLFGYTVDRAW
ncbi:MAG TPA: hypothetical protein VL172_02340, partial [Kofleriaceae bacterium]|nr:hypothetical protein [Kofleriaceae bacterium]